MGDKPRCCSGCRRGCWGQLNGGVYQQQRIETISGPGPACCQHRLSPEQARIIRRMAEPSRRGSSSDLVLGKLVGPWLCRAKLPVDCHPSSCCHQPKIPTRRRRWTPPEPEQPIRLARDGISAKILSVSLGRRQLRGWAPCRRFSNKCVCTSTSLVVRYQNLSLSILLGN